MVDFSICGGGIPMNISCCKRFHSSAVRFRFLTTGLVALFLAAPAFGQTGTSPWENAVSVLQQAFTSTIARGLSLVAIVVAGLTFAFACPPFQSWLAGQSASGCDVFMGMNPIKDGAYARTKQSIKDIHHVYLDLDRKGDEALEAIRNSTEVPPPNFVLDTSPGKHQVVWRVSGFSKEEAESLLRNLANKFGGDLAATDSTRVLRLPGFANRKLPEEFIVQARQESDAVYTLRDFTIDEDSPKTLRHFGDYRHRDRTMATGRKSQSEHDWAYAKRALARGDDPEVVIQRIADYRAEDKHDPQYYARHTFMKAQVDLRRAGSPGEPSHGGVIEQSEPPHDF
jgi:type IV secretory pathway VirB2 component (pilin)